MARSNRGGSRRSRGGSNPKRKPVAPEDETFVELDPDADDADELERLEAELDGDEADVASDPDDESDADESDADGDDADSDDEPEDDESDEDDDDDHDEDDEDLDEDEDEDDEKPSRRGTKRSTAKKQRTPRQRRGKDDDEDDDGGALGAALGGGRKKRSGTSRRERIAAMQERERREKRARSARLITLCIVLALAVLAYPVYMFVQETRLSATPRNEIGVAADAAGCLDDVEHPATGNQEHVEDGTIVDYDHLPPDSGPHYQNWTEFGETFYSVSDRPAIENLVHNLEHGYTILWYDSDTVTADEVKWIEALAKTFNGSDPVTNKFKAAPWSPQYDGGEFPEDTKFLLVRWVANPENPSDASQQFGARRACAQLSGEVVEQFMEKYPQPSSPEPLGG